MTPADMTRLREGQQIAWAILRDAFTDRVERRYVSGLAVGSDQPNAHGRAYVAAGVRCELPIPLLWQHRWDYVVGKVIRLQPVEDTLRFEAEVANNDDRCAVAKQIWSRLTAGTVRGASVLAAGANHVRCDGALR